MDAAEFEQNILKLAFETDVRITTASVAYYLGIPSRQAQPMLEELLEQGVLELDSDPEGNLFYRVADASADDAASISALKRERAAGIDGASESRGEAAGEQSRRSRQEDSPRLPAEATSASIDDDGGTEAFSPSVNQRASGEAGRQRHEAETGLQRTDSQRAETSPPRSDASRRPMPRRERQQADGGRRHAPKKTATRRERYERDDFFAGLTQRRAATDARVDDCGDRPVVVRAEASCEPRPLADSHPTFASCVDERSRRSTAMVPANQDTQSQEVGWARAQNSNSQALAATSASSAAVYGSEEQLERPEHQPGMSLLLSLILCGTGQIYNGEVSKGIMMMVLCFLLWFVLLGWVVHIWSIVDSVVVAERINRQSSGG